MQTVAKPLIRPVRDRDGKALRSIIAESNQEFRSVAPRGFFDAYLASAVDVDGRVAQGATVLIAEYQGILVGSVSYYRDANDEGMDVGFPRATAGIRATAVHPGARGLGIGRSLVRACVELARRDDAASIALHTATFMRSAIRLYERTGFRRVPRFDYPVDRFFRSDPGEGLIAQAFVRDLHDS